MAGRTSKMKGAWALVRTRSPALGVGAGLSGGGALVLGAELLGCRRWCGGELSGLQRLYTGVGGVRRRPRLREPILERDFWADRVFIGLWIGFLG